FVTISSGLCRLLAIVVLLHGQNHTSRWTRSMGVDHRAASDIEALAAQLVPDLAQAVDAPVVLENTPYLGAQRLVPFGTIRQPRRVGTFGQMVIIGGRGDRQNVADRLDPVRIPMRVDETHHHFGRRSSSAIAKYADALRRISFAWRSSR